MAHSFGNTDAEDGVTGSSNTGRGVVGTSTTQRGVEGVSEQYVGVWGEGHGALSGVYGENRASGDGVSGFSTNGRGVVGVSNTKPGVAGVSEQYVGVWGEGHGTLSGVYGENRASGDGVSGFSTDGRGVVGVSNTKHGVAGVSQQYVGVWGEGHGAQPGVYGENRAGGDGVSGFSTDGRGVVGVSNTKPGVAGVSEQYVGVWGEAHGATQPGVFGTNTAGGPAAIFNGTVAVTGLVNVTDGGGHTTIQLIGQAGDIRAANIHATGDVVLVGADCAEDFDVACAEDVDMGTVMVIDHDGVLRPSQDAYDKRVAGVISGAGDLRPGIVLDKRASEAGRLPLALVGKVYCKVDASHSPVEAGDLLTTSPTPGCAMKASDPTKAFGAVIGKALRGLESGRGLVPILVSPR